MIKAARIHLVVLLAALAGCGRSPAPNPRIPPVGADFRPEFQRGVCFSHNHSFDRGYGSPVARESLAAVKALGANYVSLSPIGYAFNLQDPRIFGYTGEDLTLTPDRLRQTIRDAHAVGLKVLLNPHIWIGLYGSPGEWRGDLAMRSDEDWKKWFANYADFIGYFARIAQEEGVELLSVGSELKTATRDRPEDWRRVISGVRSIYRGPCTYSANWSEEAERIPFWDQLEYIGISAYYPIGGGSLEARLAVAAGIRDQLAALSRRHNKPIVFLEAGFRSVAGAGQQPSAWQDQTPATPDPEEQRLCYEAWTRTFRGQPWFSGVYWWQWFADPAYAPEPATDFQFRRKPAEAVIREDFRAVTP